MKTTYKALIDFSNLANKYLQVEEEAKKKETELTAALSDALEDIKPQLEQFNKEVTRLRRKFAEKDKKTGVFLKDAIGNYQFTEEGENNLDDAVEELREQEIYIKTERIKNVPEDLPRFLRRGFAGFVIEPEKEEKEDELSPAQQLKNSLPTTKNRQNNGR